MSAERRILVVAHDAGGARALIPVVQELQRAGASAEACVGGPAASIWRRECPSVPPVEIRDDVSLPEVDVLLARHRPDILLSASGLYNRLEHTFRLAARRRGIPTVAVLDSWLNYGDRFERWMDGEVIKSHPDLVCVIDELTYEGMLAAGFRREQLIVTGAPNLEASVRLCQSVTADQRVAWRSEHGLGAEDLVLTFFSDPFVTGPDGEHFSGAGALVGPDGRSLFGYTSVEILDAILEELDTACRLAGRLCALVVRPHPAEYLRPLRPVLERRRTPLVYAEIGEDAAAAEWIGVADAILGMMTIALLEAALAGKPALSVQLGLLEVGAEDPCVGNLLGYTYPVYDRPALREALHRLALGKLDDLVPTPRRPVSVWGAAERVAAAILRLAAVGEGGRPCAWVS